MKIIVAGATGFIGYEFVNYALKEGNEVFALVRDFEKAKNLFADHNKLTLVLCELSEFNKLSSKIEAGDIFVNFAWYTKTPENRISHEIQEYNYQCSVDAFLSAVKLNCKLYVDSGSQAEYGYTDSITSENQDCNPFTEYGKAKTRLFQKYVELSEKTGLKYLHLRIFSIFGKRDHPHTLVNTCIEKLSKGEPVSLTDCTQLWNYLYVKDAAKQIYMLCSYAYNKNSFTKDVFNIASNDTRELKSFVEEIKTTMNSSSPLNYGFIKQEKVLSLQPSVEKLQKAIGFISDYTFENAIREIVNI